jgi:hypothetical protein
MLSRDHFINPEFWTRAALGGGGLGIVGDYLTNNLNSGSTGLGGVVAGPLIEMASSLRDLTAGEVAKFVAHRPVHLGRDLTRFLERWFPGDTLWYMRAPLRALIWENLLKATDPQAPEVFRRQERAARQNGQSYWWEPGHNLPSSAPNLGALVRR